MLIRVDNNKQEIIEYLESKGFRYINKNYDIKQHNYARIHGSAFWFSHTGTITPKFLTLDKYKKKTK